MRKKHFVLFLYIIIGIVGTLTGLQFLTSLNPIGIISDNTKTIFGYTMDYNIPQTIFPFYYPPSLAVVSAPTITCTLSGSLTGTTDTGTNIILSTGWQQNVSPTRTLDLTGTSGKKIAQLTVQSNINCPSQPSAIYYPNLVSGTTNIYWIAYKKDGTTVTILSDKKNINVPNLPANIGGQTVTLYTWTIPASQIESLIGANSLGDDFYSSNIIGINDNLVFYQGPATCCPWTVTNVQAAELSTRFHEQINPTGTISLSPMALQMVSPTDGNINLQAYRIVKMQASITNWSASMGNPQLLLYFTDPTSSSPNTPLLNAYLTPDPTTSGSQCTNNAFTQCLNAPTTFSYNYLFPSTSSIGRYTFELHQNGNPSVPKVNAYLTSTAPSSPPPPPPVICTAQQLSQGYTNVNGVCTQPNGPSTPTPVCTAQQLTQGYTNVNGVCTLTTGSSTCNPPFSIQNGVCLPDISSLTSYWNLIMQNIWYILAALIGIAILWHVIDSKSGGRGMRPEVIVE